MKKLIILSLFVASMSGCTSFKDSNRAKHVTATGKIQKIGMTTYQYGTHLLKGDQKTYALKSGSTNLDLYLDRTVTIKGTKVKGYPLAGGPEFVEVTLVKY